MRWSKAYFLHGGWGQGRWWRNPLHSLNTSCWHMWLGFPWSLCSSCVWNLAKEDLCHSRSFQVLLLFILVEGRNGICVIPFVNLKDLTQSMSFIHQNALHFSLYEKNQLICKQLTSRCWLTDFAAEFPTCWWSYNVCNIDIPSIWKGIDICIFMCNPNVYSWWKYGRRWKNHL